jgi:hypothetical protein
MMQEFTITVTVDEANIIAMGLGKLPLEVSVAIWQKLREQIQQQSSLTPTTQND